MRKLVVTLVVLVVILLGLDRLAAYIASSVAAAALQTQYNLTSRPDVSAHGWPFLTQVIGGKYDDVEMRSNDLHTTGLPRVSADIHARGVHAGLGALIHRSITGVPVDRVDGTVTVPYAAIVAASRLPGLTLHRSGGGVAMRASPSVAGQTVRVGAVAHIGFAAGKLTVRADQVSGLGATVPSQLAGQLAGQLSFTVPVGSLPFGISLDAARATAAGVQFSAHANDVTFDSAG